MSINLPFKKYIYIYIFNCPIPLKKYKNIKDSSSTYASRYISTAPSPSKKKHIYNNLKLSPLDRQYKNQLPANTSILPSQYIFNPPSLPPKKPTTLPPPRKNVKDMAVVVVQLTPHDIFSTAQYL